MVDYKITKEETITEENGIHLKRFEGITEYGKNTHFTKWELKANGLKHSLISRAR